MADELRQAEREELVLWSVSELDEAEKKAYLDALLAEIGSSLPPSDRHLRRLYQVFAAMELDADARRQYVEHLFLARPRPDAASWQSLPEDARFSLGKDMLSLAADSGTVPEASLLRRYAESLRLTPEQIEVLYTWTNWENGILARIGRGDLAVVEEGMPVEVMKKAAAVGIPLGALYASGSMVGFSAPGITSGLAYIGRHAGLAVFGLNSMTAGIAAMILGGVAVKKILDAVMPTAGTRNTEWERAVVEMVDIHRRYQRYLHHDERSILAGSWTDRLLGTHQHRRLAAQRLHTLLDEEFDRTVPDRPAGEQLALSRP